MKARIRLINCSWVRCDLSVSYGIGITDRSECLDEEEKGRNFFASTGIPALDNRGTDSADDIPLMSMVRV